MVQGDPDRVILVTGANGFVGSAACRALVRAGERVRGAVRTAAVTSSEANLEYHPISEIDERTDWAPALSGVSCIVHLAARAHAMDAHDPDALALYRRVNVEGTRRLAESAAQHGVKRIVYVSSIKVNGESTGAHPFSEASATRPEDAYGISKWEAEQTLQRVARESGLETVILRPPLVYGPGVKGNLLRLMRWIDRGVPLPLASVYNRRSLIYVGNLVEVIGLCIHAREARGSTYLVSDGEDVSTPDLIARLGAALGKPARLFHFPPQLLALAAGILGKREDISRLVGSLQVDSAKLRNALGWRPRTSLATGLQETARWYRATLNRDAGVP